MATAGTVISACNSKSKDHSLDAVNQTAAKSLFTDEGKHKIFEDLIHAEPPKDALAQIVTDQDISLMMDLDKMDEIKLDTLYSSDFAHPGKAGIVFTQDGKKYCVKAK